MLDPDNEFRHHHIGAERQRLLLPLRRDRVDNGSQEDADPNPERVRIKRQLLRRATCPNSALMRPRCFSIVPRERLLPGRS